MPFGGYAQMHDVPDPRFSSNVDLERTTGTICLGPTGNQRGGYNFYNLNSGRVITRYAFTELPMPQRVIDHVDELARLDSVPSSVVFADRLANPFSEDDGDGEVDEPGQVPGLPPGVDLSAGVGPSPDGLVGTADDDDDYEDNGHEGEQEQGDEGDEDDEDDEDEGEDKDKDDDGDGDDAADDDGGDADAGGGGGAGPPPAGPPPGNDGDAHAMDCLIENPFPPLIHHSGLVGRRTS